MSPALSAAYGWSLDDALAAPFDVLRTHLRQLPIHARGVDRPEVLVALTATILTEGD